MQSQPTTTAAVNAPEVVFESISRFWAGRALWAAAELGLADVLKGGAHSAGELARATNTDPAALGRLLRALVAEGYLTETGEGRFESTPLGKALESDAPGSVRAFVRAELGGDHYEAWGALLHSLRTGRIAFDHVYGMPVWKYYGEHPEIGLNFSQAMTGVSEGLIPAIVAAYDFSGFRTVVDVGGAHGRLLQAILEKHSETGGVLFDLPQVIDTATLDGRARRVAGNFFESVPAGGDAYLLKWILHDWDDGQCVTILRHCRKAIEPGGRLLVIETVVPEDTLPHLSKLIDLNMLVMTGGRERTASEYGRMFEEAGFRLTRVVPTGSPVSVIEGQPVYG